MNGFWGFVDRSGECWNWTGYIRPDGYANYQVSRKTLLAHRYSWSLVNGPIPEGMCICHKCDNRKCVNPTHLFLGTASDNMRDMVSKGRNVFEPRFGESNGQAKLTFETAEEIRFLYKPGRITLKQIASIYGVHVMAIQRIISNQTYVAARRYSQPNPTITIEAAQTAADGAK